jgi:hypothetical protein
MQNYWIDTASSMVHIHPPLSSIDAKPPSKPSILTRISSSLAASPPAQFLSKFQLRATEPPPTAEALPSLGFLPMPRKSPEDAAAAAAEILAAISVIESDAAAAAANLQQLISHLNDHTQRCTILSLPHAAVIKEAAAASSFYSHQSSQAILDFIARQPPPSFPLNFISSPPPPILNSSNSHAL